MFGFLRKKSFGLSITDDAVAFAELIRGGNGLQLGRFGEILLPSGVVQDGKIRNAQELKRALAILRARHGIKSAHLSLPDGSGEEVKDYRQIFKKARIGVRSAEPRAQAIKRALVGRRDSGTYLVVDFNRGSSAIFIVSGGSLARHAPASSAIYFLLNEINKHFISWHTDDPGNPLIEKVIICGNAENLPEFAKHLSITLKHPTETADVWANILNPQEAVPGLHRDQALAFAPALGVALKGF